MSNTFNDDPFDVHLLDTQHHHQQNSNNSNHNRGQNLSNGSNNLSVSGPGMGMNNLVFGDSTHAFDINFNIDSLDDIWTTTDQEVILLALVRAQEVLAVPMMITSWE